MSRDSLDVHLIDPPNYNRNRKMKAGLIIAVFLGVALALAGASVLISKKKAVAYNKRLIIKSIY